VRELCQKVRATGIRFSKNTDGAPVIVYHLTTGEDQATALIAAALQRERDEVQAEPKPYMSPNGVWISPGLTREEWKDRAEKAEAHIKELEELQKKTAIVVDWPSISALLVRAEKAKGEAKALNGKMEWLESDRQEWIVEAKALKVCGNCEYGKSTSLDDTRCYKATPYTPTGRHCAGCSDWRMAPIIANPRVALQSQGDEK
jgi:hypothetical protein